MPGAWKPANAWHTAFYCSAYDAHRIPHGFTLARDTGVVGGPGIEVILAGTPDEINVLLATLVYRAPPDWFGLDELSVVANDAGNRGIGGVLSTKRTLLVNVRPQNDPPVINLAGTGFGVQHDNPASWETLWRDVDEDQPISLNGITIEDVDAADTWGRSPSVGHLHNSSCIDKHDAVAMNTGFGDSPADGVVLMSKMVEIHGFLERPHRSYGSRVGGPAKLPSRSAGNGDQVEDVAGIVTGLHGFEEDGQIESGAVPRYQYWLNGKTGIVTAFNSSNGLYTVQLSDTKGTIESRKPQTFKLRRENLRSADSLIQEGYVGPSHSSKGSGSRIRSYMSPSAEARGGLYASNAGSSAVEEDRSTDSSFQFG